MAEESAEGRTTGLAEETATLEQRCQWLHDNLQWMTEYVAEIEHCNIEPKHASFMLSAMLDSLEWHIQRLKEVA